MGRVIYVDGPEKAGKSTLIKALVPALKDSGFQVEVRHWGQVKPDDRVYAEPLQHDLSTPADHITIWDRGWVAEHIYGSLLNRQRRGATNPWLMEWLHGRAVVGNGLRCIVMPANPANNIKLRDETDLPVHPVRELAAYLNYAVRYDYHVLLNDYTLSWIDSTVERLVKDLPQPSTKHPSHWTRGWMERFALSVVIGEARNRSDRCVMAGAWLPFTSPKMCAFVQKYFATEAFRFSWTNAEAFMSGVLDDKVLRDASQIFTFGETARAMVESKGLKCTAAFPHPALFARWNTERGRAALQQFESEYKSAFNLRP